MSYCMITFDVSCQSYNIQIRFIAFLVVKTREEKGFKPKNNTSNYKEKGTSFVCGSRKKRVHEEGYKGCTYRGFHEKGTLSYLGAQEYIDSRL